MTTRYKNPEQLRRHAEEMAAQRARREALGLCKSCTDVVAIRENGTPYKSCEGHLRLDRDRKKKKGNR